MLTHEEFVKAVDYMEAPESKNGYYLVDNNSSYTKVIRCNTTSCSQNLSHLWLSSSPEWGDEYEVK